ncbi:MAG TPA: TonB-dependent receptor [Verrucomicrobiae bacterium]|nr:TonB-dependent receptor [Verrucomicrobiae bacterium]
MVFNKMVTAEKSRPAAAALNNIARVLRAAALRGRWMLISVLALLLLSWHAVPQEMGAVAGVVISSWDGAPLSGTAVAIRGTTLATQTGTDGRFELKNIPPGDQTLRFSRAGFASAVVTEVRVISGQTTTVNGNLRPEFYEMEEFEVTAEEFTQQTEQILIERQQSSGMLEAIGSEHFSRVGASDAAEALSKVSGASVADGKFAVVRGLADRYTTTTLNGTDLPSADPDRKAAQLDLLPTQVIERMDVGKTFAPDMPGGFAGGAINIVTRSYPEKFFFSFSSGTSYNTQSSLNEDFLASDRGGTDWLGMDDGTRALPAIARNTPPLGSTSGPIQNEAEVERSFKSRQLSPLPEKSPLNSNFGMAIGDSFRKDFLRFGYLASLTYRNDYKFYDNGVVREYGGSGGSVVFEKTDTRAISEYSWAASAALTLGLGEDHELKYNFLFVQSAEDEARRLQGQEENYTEPGVSYLDQNILHWTERNLTYHQLVGIHDFPLLNDLKFEWAGAMSTATQEEPDYRIFQFLANPEQEFFYPASSSSPAYPTRYWRDVEENNVNARGDLTIPLASYNSKDNAIKTGAAITESQRDYFQRGLVMYPSGGGHPFYGSGEPQDYLDPANAGFVEYRNFPVNLTYEGQQTITAGYAMADWAAFEWLRLIGGARLERTDLTLEGFNQTLNQPLKSGGIQRTDVLPALSSVFSLRENLQLRAAWSQTVVRPAYREIAPVFIYDVANGRQIGGSPDLSFSESANYDLRIEWFPRPGEIVSASLFMKEVKAPIELIAVNSSDVTYFNSEKADVYGAEFEFRSRLDRIHEELDELTFGFNAASIISEVPISNDQRTLRRTIYLENSSVRPLYDQPDYVVNADLTWDHKATGMALTVSGGVVGPRLVVFGLTSPDEFEEPAPQLDLFLSQKIGKHWKAKLSAKNLLDPSVEVSQTWPGGGKRTIKSYTRGMTFSLSLGCEF